MRVLVAPDKFKGTLTAPEAAAAIAKGWRSGRPGDEVANVPMADGGEGTLDVLVSVLAGELRTTVVTGPLGEAIHAEYGVAEDAPGGRVAIVEMARASGLPLIPPDRRDPLRATTRGTGELILAACSHRPRRLIVCIGGSATNDAGAGMVQALGVRLLDSNGEDLPPGGAALRRLERIDASGSAPDLSDVDVVVACDVDNPLLGQRGASAVFGPQKGASPNDIQELDAALERFADVAERELGVRARDRPGAGAGGGLGFGLITFLNARMVPGVELVMDAVGFEERLREADLVITGEGKLDRQSLHGKTPAGVLRTAAARGLPVILLCGSAEVDVPNAQVATLVEAFGPDRAQNDAAAALTELARETAGAWPEGAPPA